MVLLIDVLGFDTQRKSGQYLLLKCDDSRLVLHNRFEVLYKVQNPLILVHESGHFMIKQLT